MSIKAGASEVEITPKESQFLFGYPHVERYSTGTNDPLLSAALILDDGKTTVVFVTNDVIFVDKKIVASARRRIEERTGIAGENVFISASHTHSGPLTVDHLSNEGDPVVPRADIAFRTQLEDGIVEAVSNAYQRLAPAGVGLITVDSTGIGTNRRDPAGPADLTVPVLYVEDAASSKPVACMVICSMHPTVLHEDSTLVSADFPGYARSYVKREWIGVETPFLYHTGPAGNQSPRHVTKANTFDEAGRLGEILGRAIVGGRPLLSLSSSFECFVRHAAVDLPAREFPSVADAEMYIEKATEKLERLRRDDASRQDVRSAEVDLFGAEETLTFAKANATGRVEAFVEGCLPAEIMAVAIGPWTFVGWPGELFVEYALELKATCRDTFLVSLANGELQGYIVTEEASREPGYEAQNALFHYSSGAILTRTTAELLDCP